MMLEKNVAEVVGGINQDLYEFCCDKYGEGEFDIVVLLEYGTDGFSESVTFLGSPIWDSENEDRQFDENAGRYVPDIGSHLLNLIHERVRALQPLLNFTPTKE